MRREGKPVPEGGLRRETGLRGGRFLAVVCLAAPCGRRDDGTGGWRMRWGVREDAGQDACALRGGLAQVLWRGCFVIAFPRAHDKARRTRCGRLPWTGWTR